MAESYPGCFGNYGRPCCNNNCEICKHSISYECQVSTPSMSSNDLKNLRNLETRFIGGTNQFLVTAGTTGHKGGDAGHGGMAFLDLKNEANTWIEIEIIDQLGKLHKHAGVESVKLIFRGDAEIDTFQKALQIGSRVLRRAD